jgi:hypothetical protein
MTRQTFGILVGALSAAVLTPLIATLWRRFAPPTPERSDELSIEAWHRSDTISKEALIVTGLAGLILTGYVGLGTALDSLVVVMFISGLFGIPTVWILLRTGALGRGAVEDYARYYEKKHGISFISWLYISIPAFVISVGCFVSFLRRQ